MPSDAYWMNAKRDGQCSECESDIREGDRIVWDAREFKAYCEVCGPDIVDEPTGTLDDEVEG